MNSDGLRLARETRIRDWVTKQLGPGKATLWSMNLMSNQDVMVLAAAVAASILDAPKEGDTAQVRKNRARLKEKAT